MPIGCVAEGWSLSRELSFGHVIVLELVADDVMDVIQVAEELNTEVV